MIEFSQWLESHLPAKPASCFLALVGSVLVLSVIGTVWGFRLYGSQGALAAVVAALVCGIAAIASLAVVVLTVATNHRVAGLLASMLIRMGLPLAAGVVLSRGPLGEFGVFGMIVCYYLAMLVIETGLSVSLIGRATGRSAV